MSNKTPIKKAAKRKPQSKEELLSQIDANNKVTHIKEVVKLIFPYLETVDTIYDAQTVSNALSGFIMAHIESKLKEIKLKDVPIDLSKEEESKIKTAIESIIELMKDEPAKELSQTLERLGTTLASFGADKFLKQPMTEIKLEDIVKQ